MTITRTDVDPDFKFQVTGRPGGGIFMKCFECGTCAGVCPMSENDPEFDPRKVLHMIKLGLKDRLLGSRAIWSCNHCNTCTVACPQGVRLSDLIGILRRMAIEQGYADPATFHQWGTSPCKAACPANISVQGFIGALARGKYLEGLKLIKNEMPFPGICGRVCPHPCEMKCSRTDIDVPTSIMSLKRFLADRDLASTSPFVPEKTDSRKEKVAIIGSGPAGLSAAYFLAIAGYSVCVFEKLPVAGGMMAVGIPRYRLPRKILDAEIGVVEKLSVEIRLDCEVGKDIEFEALRREFQSVFIGIGCHRGVKLGIRGENEFEGTIDCIRFLRDVNLGRHKAGRGRLVVVGGGNAAVDCARVARRIGFEEVTILYRRTREEMPASRWEIEDAFDEGVRIEFLTAPVEILGSNGSVSGIKCLRMALGEPDKSGRRRPVPVEGSEFEIRTDCVVPAIGQSCDLSFLSASLSPAISQKDLIRTDPMTGATAIPGLFAGGDAVSGPATVVEAVAFGKRAARAMDRYLRGESSPSAQPLNWEGIAFKASNSQRLPRVAMPRLFLGERKRSFKEIDLGYTEEQARLEAGRCLRFCGSQRGPEANKSGE